MQESKAVVGDTARMSEMMSETKANNLRIHPAVREIYFMKDNLNKILLSGRPSFHIFRWKSECVWFSIWSRFFVFVCIGRPSMAFFTAKWTWFRRGSRLNRMNRMNCRLVATTIAHRISGHIGIYPSHISFEALLRKRKQFAWMKSEGIYDFFRRFMN